MATLERHLVVWNGLVGLPGVSVMYGTPGGSLHSELTTFFTALVSAFPIPMTWQIPNNGDTIDDASGTLNGTWSDGTTQNIAATGSSPHAAGCGAYVNWRTGAIVGGRRLKGRTFLAPIQSALYQSDGTIATVTLGVLQSAASALAASGELVIWHRPQLSGPGSSSVALAATVPDQVTSLRSRRR